ncbi:MAG: response regulator [Thermodesulfovibrionales bacterium]
MKKILVIDRDRLVCKILKIYLENTGKYRVRYSTDIVQAVVSAMSKKIELILFDERVETADGINFLNHIQSTMPVPVPLLPTGAVLDRAGLKMAGELNAVFNKSMLKQIDALVK